MSVFYNAPAIVRVNLNQICPYPAISYGSKVYLCKRKEDASFLVIKQIPVDEMGIDERKASQTEVEVLGMLKHPNIIAYFDNFMQDKSMMIVMEYAPGKPYPVYRAVTLGGAT